MDHVTLDDLFEKEDAYLRQQVGVYDGAPAHEDFARAVVDLTTILTPYVRARLHAEVGTEAWSVEVAAMVDAYANAGIMFDGMREALDGDLRPDEDEVAVRASELAFQVSAAEGVDVVNNCHTNIR